LLVEIHPSLEDILHDVEDGVNPLLKMLENKPKPVAASR